MNSEQEIMERLAALRNIEMSDTKYDEILEKLSADMRSNPVKKRINRHFREFGTWLAAIAAVLVVGIGIYGIQTSQHTDKLGAHESNTKQITSLLKQVPQSDLNDVVTVLKQNPKIHVPRSIPFTVTHATTSIRHPGISKKILQIEIDFFDNSKDLLSETAVETQSGSVGNPSKIITLRNGIKAYVSKNSNQTSISWNEDGYFYILTSDGSGGGKILSVSDLTDIANQMT